MHPLKDLRLAVALLAGFVLLIPFPSTAQTARRTKSGIGYLEYLPAKPTGKVIVYLHGSGLGGSGSSTDLQKLKEQGLVWQLEHGLKIPFIVLAPQQAATKNGFRGSPGLAVTFIKEISKQYKTTDIILTGFSMGADGSYYTAARDNSHLIRAIVPIAPANTDYRIGDAVGKKNIPVRVYWGQADPYYVDQKIIPHYQAVNGYRNAGGLDLVEEVIPGGGHDETTWSKVYGDKKMYDWLDSLCQKKPK